MLKPIFKILFILFCAQQLFAQNGIEFLYDIKGRISPKSVVHNGNGLFAAQNMMYRHTITIYNQKGELLKTIKDHVNLQQYGFDEYQSEDVLGAPVEACFSNNGKVLWVSNYNMTGEDFNRVGCDACIGDKYDPSFVYKINTETFAIENVIKVGAVPKFMAVNEKTKKLLVSNWTSSDVSVIDLITEKEIKRVKVGAHPRGIAITSDGNKAYVAIMGSTKIAVINMEDYSVSYIENVGKSPRHLILSNDNQFLYCAVNSSNKLSKITLNNESVLSCKTNSGPRTMVMSPEGNFIYVVNYFTDTFQKIETKSMQVVETIKTGHHPIGITANWSTSEIWVACYEGRIQVFKDNNLPPFEELIVANNGPKIKMYPKINTQKYLAENGKVIQTQTQFIEEVNNSNIIEQEVELTSCSYHLIIGSFGVKSNAEKLKNKMVEKGYNAQLLPSDNKKMTMVSVACFANEWKANSEKDTILKAINKNGWIYKN